jgi:hypothetical membrane protein
MGRIPLSTRTLATGAAVGFAIFPIVVALLNLVQRNDYSVLHQAMSELALGRGGWLMNTAFCALGLGTLLLALTLKRTLPGMRVVPVLLAVTGLLDVASAIFHTNGDGPATTQSQIHMIAGISTFILFVVAIFLSSRSFRRDPAWQRLARPTIVWGIAAVATFFLIPILGNTYFGLAQRTFAATWITWAIAIALHARSLAPATGRTHRAHDSKAEQPIETPLQTAE